MNIKDAVQQSVGFGNLDFLAKQVVEGFISGMHKSPFHGFSAEFAEHKVYNQGESTRHIDWKLYAKTDKLFTKRYDDETNLRCHFVLDNSSSMHYPLLKKQSLELYNKIGFSALSIASLMNLLKKQRDAVGLSVYNNHYDYYAPEKGSERHHAMLLNQLDLAIHKPNETKGTDTYTILHQIAEKLHKRSMVVLFSDMFETSSESDKLFEALQHLKHNKHEVILFHTLDYKTEVDFSFEAKPQRFIDVETGKHLDLYAENAKEAYKEAMEAFADQLKTQCAQYRIHYVPVDIQEKFHPILTRFLVQRQKFI
ncbi:DUF58 domain-containing protein [Aquimarina agarilytica]|uniref:DUF58 domain-containing protein n=1 Tax=Aquimarina agarilytica TaxID=1087449 RepID=UPI0002886C8B|nr:DUF58 domain-containing protein [Aquimarina agarilytica]